MRFYRHHVVKEYELLIDDAWINRITHTNHEGVVCELWLFWLPSYGMEFDYNTDADRWSQRGFLINLRTGQKRMTHKPVRDSSSASACISEGKLK